MKWSLEKCVRMRKRDETKRIRWLKEELVGVYLVIHVFFILIGGSTSVLNILLLAVSIVASPTIVLIRYYHFRNSRKVLQPAEECRLLFMSPD